MLNLGMVMISYKYMPPVMAARMDLWSQQMHLGPLLASRQQTSRHCRNQNKTEWIRECKTRVFRIENEQILYGMERRIGKSMRQKHCGTAAGLTPILPENAFYDLRISFVNLWIFFLCDTAAATEKGSILGRPDCEGWPLLLTHPPPLLTLRRIHNFTIH